MYQTFKQVYDESRGGFAVMVCGKVLLKLKRVGLITATCFGLAACEGVPTISSSTGPTVDLSKPVQVALLTPRSSGNEAAIARDMENAARMAVADLGQVKVDLRTYDTAGNAQTAAQAAQQAVDEGAKIIVGPLFAEAANAAGVAVVDEGVNVLSFSNNSTIAGGNVFILGKTFDNTAARLVKFAAEQGKSRAVIVHPLTVEGDAGRIAFERAIARTNIDLVSVQGFEFSQQGVVNAVPNIRNAVLSGNADLLLITSTSSGALPLLAQLLPEAGVDPNVVQYAGLARWDIPPQTLVLSGVQNGWFAMPDYSRTSNFAARFTASYGNQPHQLASLAYDGIAAVGALLSSGKANALSTEGLTQSAGFEGVDGIFRFNKNGTNERGLAIAQVQQQQVVIIDAAPQTFGSAGF